MIPFCLADQDKVKEAERVGYNRPPWGFRLPYLDHNTLRLQQQGANASKSNDRRLAHAALLRTTEKKKMMRAHALEFEEVMICEISIRPQLVSSIITLFRGGRSSAALDLIIAQSAGDMASHRSYGLSIPGPDGRPPSNANTVRSPTTNETPWPLPWPPAEAAQTLEGRFKGEARELPDHSTYEGEATYATRTKPAWHGQAGQTAQC